MLIDTLIIILLTQAVIILGFIIYVTWKATKGQ